MKSPKILAYHTIAACGDFGQHHTHDKIRNWVVQNGGQFVTEIKSNVTHLIVTREAHRKKLKMGMCPFPFALYVWYGWWE